MRGSFMSGYPIPETLVASLGIVNTGNQEGRCAIASIDEQLPPGPDWVGRKFADLDRDMRELRAARSGRVFSGTGDPNGVLVADVGALFLRTDGGASTTLWVKESGGGTSSGWVAK